MDDRRSRGRTRAWLVPFVLGVTIVANALAVLFLLAVTLPLMGDAGRRGGPSSPEELMSPGGAALYHTLNTLFVFVVPFAATGSVGLAYTWPAAFGRELDERVKRRILGLPVFNSAIGLMGWTMAAVASVSLDLGFLTFESSSQRIGTVFADTAINLSTGVLAFLFAYYLLDLAHRRLIVPRYLPEGRLSAVPRTLRISVRWRFALFFFSVCVLPMGVLVTAIVANSQVRKELPTLLAFVGGLFVVGGGLTVLLSRSFDLPLEEMSRAVAEIREREYGARVAVRSTDALGILGEGINEMAAGLAERELIRDVFGRMVDPAVRDHLLSGAIHLGGETRLASALFCDVKGFTSLAERLRPDEVVSLLNRFFGRMGRAIAAEGGFVNKFMGDALLAIFGAPAPLDNSPRRALDAALSMSRSLDELRAELEAEGLPLIEAGIGVHTGDVLAGTIGFEERMEYTVIGDAVNVASRIEGLTRDFGVRILASGETLRAAEGGRAYVVRHIDDVRVKGRTGPLAVYEIVGHV